MKISDFSAASVLFCLLYAFPSGAQTTDSLTSILHELPTDRLLEITLDTGRISQGHLVQVRADSLGLEVRTETAVDTVQLAVAEIVRIRERRSNTGRGAGWGATSGAFVGGGLGLLSGLYLASINDSNSSDAGPVVLGTAAGAAVGAAIFGLTGAGIGALTGSWRDLYGPGLTDRTGTAGEESAPTRLNLAVGAGFLEVRGVDFDGFAWRLGLSKPISAHVEMGPHFELVHLGAAQIRDHGTYTESISTDNPFHSSFGAKAHLKRIGFGPYAALGAGWYWANGGYLGGHAGGGLRYLSRRGTDVNLDARWHFNITEIDRGSSAGYLTVTAGIAFDL